MEEAHFLGVWMDEGVRWTGQVGRIGAKVGRLLGVYYLIVGGLRNGTLPGTLDFVGYC